MRDEKDVYIGDSVYATNDGFHLVLYTDNGMGRDQKIYLDHGVFERFIEYAKKIGFHATPGDKNEQTS